MSLTYVLLGGPYDGAKATSGTWPDPPETVYVCEDPQSRGRFGLRMWRFPQPDTERYVLTDLQPGEFFYQHESVGAPIGPFLNLASVR